MTSIDIEYCVPCGLASLAIEAEQALLEEYGRSIDRVTLLPSHGGVFEIRVDDDVVWDADVHGRDIDHNLIADVVRKRAAAAE